MPLLQADAARTPQQEKRRQYYLKRREYYLEQGKVWRDANKEHRKEHAARIHKDRKLNNPVLYLWKYAKARSNYDKMEFNLELEDIIMPDVCPYFKTPFVMGDQQWAASLDRVDSTKGYTKDNIMVISYMANKMKNDATKEQLIAFAKGVLAVHSKAGCWDASIAS